jgi:hypothetical protein
VGWKSLFEKKIFNGLVDGFRELFRVRSQPGVVVGEESFARWQGIEPVSRSRADYPALTEATIAGHPPGSSAGGERPKFGALVGNQHMLVKFAGRGGIGDMAARRWCDLLILEGIASQVVVSHGIPTALQTSSKRLIIGFWRASDLIAWECAGGLQS